VKWRRRRRSLRCATVKIDATRLSAGAADRRRLFILSHRLEIEIARRRLDDGYNAARASQLMAGAITTAAALLSGALFCWK
jgi:hypothetical protein